MYSNVALSKWVEEIAQLMNPDKIIWIDGSDAEEQKLTDEAVATGELIELNQIELPGCLYHRTDANDVARVEHLTYICTSTKDDARSQ